MYSVFTTKLKSLFCELMPTYIGTAHSRAGAKIVIKQDGTPVGDLDNYSADRLRALISEFFQDDVVIGEEDQRDEKELREILKRSDQHQWTVDGLDGTRNFYLETNSFGAMVARRHADLILYAAIFRPIDQRLRGNGFFFAEQGEGAWRWCQEHGAYHRLRTAASGELERRTVMLEGSSKNFFKSPISELGKVVTVRPGLSTCVASTTVASGCASAFVTIENKPWDNWPAMLLIKEAGGVVTDYCGREPALDHCGNLLAAANEDDHAYFCKVLKK